MQNKRTDTEKNIEMLLNTSFDKKHQLDRQLKNDMLHILEQKVAQNSKEPQPKVKIAIGLSAVWMALLFIFFLEGKISIYMFDLLKPVLGLSMVFVPISSIILIILKFWTHEKRIV